jgi:hypothetical protein
MKKKMMMKNRSSAICMIIIFARVEGGVVKRF